jgi:hypothetical protein
MGLLAKRHRDLGRSKNRECGRQRLEIARDVFDEIGRYDEQLKAS